MQIVNVESMAAQQIQLAQQQSQQQQQQHQQQQQSQQHQQLQQSQQQSSFGQHQYQVSNVQITQTGPSAKRQTRKNRVNFTSDQLEVLEKAFEETAYPDAIKREEIAKLADLPETRVQVSTRASYICSMFLCLIG